MTDSDGDFFRGCLIGGGAMLVFWMVVIGVVETWT